MVMSQKKDLYNLHCSVKQSTAEKLKALSENLGLSLAEVIDRIVENYEDHCNKEDEVFNELKEFSFEELSGGLPESKEDEVEDEVLWWQVLSPEFIEELLEKVKVDGSVRVTTDDGKTWTLIKKPDCK